MKTHGYDEKFEEIITTTWKSKKEADIFNLCNLLLFFVGLVFVIEKSRIGVLIWLVGLSGMAGFLWARTIVNIYHRDIV